MSISFVSCNGDIFSFTSDKIFKYGKFTDVEKKLIEDWQTMVKTKGSYRPSNQLQLPSNPTSWTKEKIISYLNQNKGCFQQYGHKRILYCGMDFQRQITI